MNYGLRRLESLGVTPKEIRVTGGGAKSAVWRQIMADVFGVPVVAMMEDEGAALGGALQAAWCVARQSGRGPTDLVKLVRNIVKVDATTRCKPDRRRHAHYRHLQELQDELGLASRRVFARQRELTRLSVSN
jgi:xylulokinase